MKIGIFGDSFGQRNAFIGHPGVEGQPGDHARTAWWDYLAQDGYGIDNRCVSGSSLYHSFTEFKKFHRSCDYIIVLVTNWSRHWLPQLKTVYPWVPGYRQAEYLLNICKDEDDKLILKALSDYYLYVEEKNYSMDMHRLMCNEMLASGKKVLLIPCFGNDEHSLVPNWTGPCLDDVSRIDSDFYGIDLHASHCRRHGHINDANHYVMYQKLSEWIKSEGTAKFEINIADFKQPTEPFEHNFFRSKSPVIDRLTGKVISQ